MKKLITESQLKKIVSESIKKVLKEDEEFETILDIINTILKAQNSNEWNDIEYLHSLLAEIYSFLLGQYSNDIQF